MKLAEDLSIDPTNDPLMLVLLYKLQCKPQFRLFKSDFISVLQSYRYAASRALSPYKLSTSCHLSLSMEIFHPLYVYRVCVQRFSQVEHIKDMLSKWKREIYGDQKEFKKFYAYCFKNNLEASQKVLGSFDTLLSISLLH